MLQVRSLKIAVPSAAHSLEARLCTAPERERAGLALVAPPHPLYGGSIGNPVVRAIEAALQATGLATLAFNFRGVGESGGEPSGDLTDGTADYLAAARALPHPLRWLSGYSFGSCAALASAIELSVPRVLLVAPPLALLDPALVERYPGEQTVVVGEHDDYAPLDDLRDVFARAAHVRLEVLKQVDHFFLGSQVQELTRALATVLR